MILTCRIHFAVFIGKFVPYSWVFGALTPHQFKVRTFYSSFEKLVFHSHISYSLLYVFQGSWLHPFHPYLLIFRVHAHFQFSILISLFSSSLNSTSTHHWVMIINILKYSRSFQWDTLNFYVTYTITLCLLLLLYCIILLFDYIIVYNLYVCCIQVYLLLYLSDMFRINWICDWIIFRLIILDSFFPFTFFRLVIL